MLEMKMLKTIERPMPTSTRSILHIKTSSKIDPKDKGKKKIEEEEESETEEERNKIVEEKATNEALIKNFDDIKARIEADKILPEKLQEQRSEASKKQTPTKNQLRNQMMTYLKHVGNFKHSELKSKKFEDIQVMYEKIKRSDEDFIAIGSVEDDKEHKKNKKDSPKKKKFNQGNLKKKFDSEVQSRITRRVLDSQHAWKVISWEAPIPHGLHTLMTDEGLVFTKHIVISVLEKEIVAAKIHTVILGPLEDPEEDPADYPADRGDDDDDDDAEEEGHLVSADPAAIAYSADQDPYLAYRRDALPSPVHETEMPEICLPLCKRPCRTTPGPGYEVGESSAAGTARQVGPATARADLYGFADMLDAAPGRQTSRELGYGITDTWDDLVGAIQEIAPTTLEGVNQRVTELATTVDQEDEIIYSQLDDARHDRALLRARVNMLYRDRPFHRRTALLMEEEARVSRAAWAQSMDACDQVRSEGISLRTTVMAQQSEITELQAADRRRQTVISDLLKADHRRQRQLVEALKIVKSLKTQMIELQRQQGPAKDPAEPELPEEASSSS
ncbi:hypothetical protein Tco_0738714 [Tanacetum coccineum]